MSTYSVSRSFRGWAVYNFIDTAGWTGTATLVGAGYVSRKKAIKAARRMAGRNGRVVVNS